MRFPTLFRGLNSGPRGAGRARSRKGVSPPRRSTVPRLEALVDRTTPSTLAVTNLNDGGPGSLRTAVTAGYSAVAELNPHGRHALSLHGGEVGFWAHDLAVAGASYRYRNGWMELRLGYFYRFSKSGGQSAPLAAFGVLL